MEIQSERPQTEDTIEIQSEQPKTGESMETQSEQPKTGVSMEIQSEQPRIGNTTDIQFAQPQKKSNKKIFIAMSAIMLVVVLVGAAFLAGKLMNKQSTGPMRQIISGEPGGIINGSSDLSGVQVSEGSSIPIDLKPALELPTTPPETNGVFTRRVDNSIFLGTGSLGITVLAGPSGSGEEANPSYDGPEVEIVVTKETRIYRDVTPFDINLPSGSIQQTVEIGNLDDFNSMTMITVWGRKIGDRIVADVILYQAAMVQIDPNQ